MAMLDDPVAIVLLLITGVVALILALLLFKDYMENQKLYHAFWGISLLVLFVSGVLIILMDFDVLDEPLVPVVAALIPTCLAIGLFFAAWEEEQYGWYYAVYAVLGIIAVAVVRLMEEDLEDFNAIAIMAVHVPAALIIIGIPLYTALVSKETEVTSILFSIGGLLISVGGVLLAMLELDDPPLTKTEIYDILPLLLLIVGVFFVLGIILPSKWKPAVPYLDKPPA
ncbi:MAG: hypothetical protein ACXACI_02675 [Candidatus Hodarchaeales archaeon]